MVRRGDANKYTLNAPGAPANPKPVTIGALANPKPVTIGAPANPKPVTIGALANPKPSHHRRSG